ncbi:MFS transporter [Pseudovibrio sp. Tun.PSC04-5.I4]|uniref:MFS transporter n=1 Tax=Pseudovibrio sp. Tun.PSC04-5.I4 TaxID=1798213 RepID=UPI000890F327|nr:MFS transporter [Pseudovibrio sp. Tun.PSC04-5.I4]SDQ20052.1 Predicted arabinose efflux permease, MFS family [Pseudovibrio sp. Tun.PSC04-5.I4]
MQEEQINTSILPLFKISAFRRFFGVLVPAAFADWIDLIAILVLVSYTWEMGPTEVAIVTLAATLPRVIFGIPAGVLVDRIGAGPVLMAGLLLRTAFMVAMFFFAVGILPLVVLVFLKASVASAFMPAQQLALKKIVPQNMLTQAVSADHFVIQTTKIFAPVLGGALLTIWSPHQVFLLGALCFAVASLACMSLLSALKTEKTDAVDEQEPTQSSALADAKEGLLHVWQTPRLLLGVGLICLFIFSVFLYEAVLLLLVKETGQPEASAGPIMGSIGVGGLIGAYLTAKIGDRVNLQLLMILGLFFSGFGATAAGWLPFTAEPVGLNMQMVLWFAAGIAGSFITVPYGAIIVKQTPEKLLGRVSSVGEMLQSGLTLVAIPVGALLAEQWFVSMPFFVGGVVMSGGALVGFAVYLNLSQTPVEEPEVSEEAI